MKKRYFSIIAAIVLCLSMALSFAACNNEQDLPGGGDVEPPVESSDIYLVENGTTQYRIVIPDEPSEIIEFAARELKEMYQLSTGIELQIVSSSTAGDSLSDFNLSIGETKLKEKAQVDTDSIRETGYRIVLKEKTLILAGGADYGSLYAVYDFLERTLGYKFYADDEVVVNSVYTAKLINFDYTFEPEMPYRGLCVRSVNMLHGAEHYQVDNSPTVWGWPHSYNYTLPPTKYPQYYKSGSSNILCLTDHDMWDDFADRVIEKFEEDPSLRFYMLGAEDAHGTCSCDECAASNAKYTYTGTYILFGNYVAKKVREYFAETDPGRDVNIMLLAYFDSKDAPVVTDTQTGETKLIAPELKAEENLYVQVCLVYQDFASSIYSPSNSYSYIAAKNWTYVTDKLWAYIYDGWEVNNAMLFFFDWEYKNDTINALCDLGYEQVHWEMAPVAAKVVSFEKLRTYYTAQLLRDPSQNSNELIRDFINNYYKDAAPYIQQYFDTVTLNFKMAQTKLAQENKVLGQYVQINMNKYLFDELVWPELMLEQILDMFNKAIAAIEANQDYSDAERDNLLMRVRKEQLFPRYYQLSIYKDNYSEEVYLEMAEQFNSDVAEFGGTTFIEV